MSERKMPEMKPCVAVTATFPSHKLAELQKKNAFEKYPRDAEGGTYHFTVVTRTSEGYKVIAITEPAEGKMAAECRLQVNRQQVYDDIEGYESTVEACSIVRGGVDE